MASTDQTTDEAVETSQESLEELATPERIAEIKV